MNLPLRSNLSIVSFGEETGGSEIIWSLGLPPSALYTRTKRGKKYPAVIFQFLHRWNFLALSVELRDSHSIIQWHGICIKHKNNSYSSWSLYIRIHPMLSCRTYPSSNNAESLDLYFSAFLSISVPSALIILCDDIICFIQLALRKFFFLWLILYYVMMTGIQLARKDSEVSFQATLGIHLLLSLCLMLQVWNLNFVCNLIFSWSLI